MPKHTQTNAKGRDHDGKTSESVVGSFERTSVLVPIFDLGQNMHGSAVTWRSRLRYSSHLQICRHYVSAFTSETHILYCRVCVMTTSFAIKGCATYCKAHAKINRKTENSTPCKIVTPQNFSSKLCTRDYVWDGNRPANFCANRLGGASPQLGEI